MNIIAFNPILKPCSLEPILNSGPVDEAESICAQNNSKLFIPSDPNLVKETRKKFHIINNAADATNTTVQEGFKGFRIQVNLQ